jgi:hypothetical protein
MTATIYPCTATINPKNIYIKDISNGAAHSSVLYLFNSFENLYLLLLQYFYNYSEEYSQTLKIPSL